MNDPLNLLNSDLEKIVLDSKRMNVTISDGLINGTSLTSRCQCTMVGYIEQYEEEPSEYFLEVRTPKGTLFNVLLNTIADGFLESIAFLEKESAAMIDGLKYITIETAEEPILAEIRVV